MHSTKQVFHFFSDCFTFEYMKSNQKYSQEEMYLAIEMWKESGLSQKQFCRQENLAHGTFQYWHEKYKGNTPKKKSKPCDGNSFIPVEVSSREEIIPAHVMDDNITITYPNGVQVTCPVTMSEQRLKTLIRL